METKQELDLIEPGIYKIFNNLNFTIKSVKDCPNWTTIRVLIDIKGKEFVFLLTDVGFPGDRKWCGTLGEDDENYLDDDTSAEQPISFGKNESEAIYNLIDELISKGKI